VLLSTSISICLITLLFWQQDWQYSRPTPRPDDLLQPAVGQRVALAPALGVDSRPLLLHFFNPACPCSRFNLRHFQELQRRYGARVRFVALLQAESSTQSVVEIQAAFRSAGLAMDSVVDTGGELARQLGVYSTPQAVLLNTQQQIFFRGNYNSSRYCTSRDTEYARIAIEALLAGRSSVPLPASASVAFGCPLRKSALAKKPQGTT
jgi:hypothetical protein